MTEQVTADELEAILQRIEAQNARIKDETEARKDIYTEAKNSGYCVQTLKMIVKLRAKTRSQIDEERSMLELYATAIGMQL